MTRGQIQQYRVTGKSEQQLIDEARQMQQWINGRIDAVTTEGIPKNATIGPLQKTPPSAIKTVKQAQRVIARGKKLANNPLTDIRKWRKLVKEAEAEYGKGRRFKIIADPTNPRKPKLVPYGTNEKAKKYVAVRDLIGEYWEWYEAIGQMFFDSEQALEILIDALDYNKDPIDAGEAYIKDELGQWDEYIELYDIMYNTDRASGYL